MAKSLSITFRVSQEEHKLLTSKIDENFPSANEVARQLVRDALNGNQHEGSGHEGLEIIHEELEELRKDISVATRALLVKAGQVTIPDADKWVKLNMSRSSGQKDAV